MENDVEILFSAIYDLREDTYAYKDIRKEYKDCKRSIKRLSNDTGNTKEALLDEFLYSYETIPNKIGYKDRQAFVFGVDFVNQLIDLEFIDTNVDYEKNKVLVMNSFNSIEELNDSYKNGYVLKGIKSKLNSIYDVKVKVKR